MSKGKKQTQTQNTSQSGTSLTNTGATINRTDTPDVPDWVLKPFQDLAGHVAGLGNLDPASLVPGASSLQQQAAAGASRLGTYPGSGGAQRQSAGLPPPSGVPTQQQRDMMAADAAAREARGGAGGGSVGGTLTNLSGLPKTYDASGLKPYDPNAPVDPNVNSDDFGGGRPGTLSAGGGGGGAPMGAMPSGAGPQTSPASGGGSNPWGSALDRIGGLTGSPENYRDAADMARSAGSAGATGYDPTLGRSTGYKAATGEAVGYDPTLAKGRGYDATGYGSTDYGSKDYGSTDYGSTDYIADVYGGAKVGPAASVLDNLKAYENPYREDIINPLLADFDANAGRVRAQQDLDLAGSGAFGGSGAALTKSETEGQLSRARASTLSPILQDLFKTSAGMSEADAGRRQATTLAQAGYDQEAGLTGAAARTGAAKDNATLRTTASRDNAALQTTAARDNAALQTTAARDNAALRTQAAKDNADAEDAARKFGATTDNDFSGRNQDAANQAAAELAAARNKQTGQNVDAVNTAASTTAAARNTQTLANQDASNEASKFGATQTETALQRQLDAAKGLSDITGAGTGTQRDIASTLADIAAAYGGDQRANIGTQAALGDTFRNIAGEQAQAPIQLTDEVVSLLQKLGLDKFIGQKTAGTTNTISNTNSSGTSNGKSTTQDYNSPMDTIGQAIQIASLFASDRRLKRDVILLGRRADGLGLYLFRYLWSEIVHLGVMAQEVLGVRPEAVVTHPSGFFLVDYSKLGEA